MKKAIILVCSMYMYSACNQTPNQTMIQLRTQSIYHRYYLIKRLEQSCFLLQDVSVQQKMAYELLQEDMYRVPEVHLVVLAIKREKSLQPFFSLWEDFCAYRHMYNQHFEHECAQLIYNLFQLACRAPVSVSHISLENLLAHIDYTIDVKKRSLATRHVKMQEEAPEHVSTDAIAKRFYCLKRLKRSMDVLQHIHGDRIDYFEDTTLFQHERVRDTVMQMNQSKNLEPLLDLCNEVKQYRFAHDDTFLQEMLMNIFLAYKTMLFKHASSTHTAQVVQEEMAHVLEIYEHMHDMPLDETLSAIDMVTDKLMEINAEKQSIKGYFALLGVCCAALGVGAYYVASAGFSYMYAKLNVC